MAPQWTAELLRLTLRGGSVYHLQHRKLTSAKPHYFVVLNLDPHADTYLVLAVITSKTQNVHRRFRDLPDSTLVEISPSDYSDAHFTKPSIVNCNTLFRVTKNELLAKLQASLAWEKKPVPAELLGVLRQGILDSPLVEKEIKSLIGRAR